MSEVLETPEEREFSEWLLHPVTKRMRSLMQDQIESLRDKWQSGAFLDQFQSALVIENAIAIGNCQVLERLLDLKAEDLEEEK